jgi:putative transposase
MNYRRSKAKGTSFFFTLVTYKRKLIFSDKNNIALLRNVIHTIKTRHPFNIDAFVLLPEHLHCIWTLPEGDNDFSLRWRLIKSYFTRECSLEYKKNSTLSRIHKGERCIWQRRFWEHQIIDEEDFRKHVEYIHYNPVKHGHVKKPHEWPYSSFHRYIKEEIYPIDWGAGDDFSLDSEVGKE